MMSVVAFLVLLVLITPPLGARLYDVYTRDRIGRVEGAVYRLLDIDPNVEQSWRRYGASVLWFSLASMVFLYVLLRSQGVLPLNPTGLPGVDGVVAFNAASSFVTNTNWQAYGGETTMSHLSQTVGLTVQNFVSAAVGMAVMVAMVRGFARARSDVLGNFWRDLVRGTLYVLLPLSAVVAIVLVSQGVVQTFAGPQAVTGVQGFEQVIARGPVASQVAIKQLGTNGGGFFNANSAHPFEGGMPVATFVELLAILAIPSALTATFGRMVGNRRQGWAVFAAMFVLLVGGLLLTLPADHTSSGAMRAAGLPASAANLEGKEVRIGVEGSAVWSAATTAASNGSVNSMHDSYRPLGQLGSMFNMGVGEVAFGGVGSGLYGMLFYVVIAVFMGGLMIGRTPEYLGKKIGPREVKIAVIAILVPALLVLGLAAVGVVVPQGTGARLNRGPHGFSEILYAFLSMGNNNGSAFAGLTASGPFYAVSGGVLMLAARFVPLLCALALGGSVAGQPIVPDTPGTLHTDTRLFVVLLVFVIVVIGALTFLPALVLGPIVEQLLQDAGRLF